MDITKISPQVVNFLHDQDNKVALESMVEKYGLNNLEGKYYLGGLAKMKEGTTKEILSSQGVIIGTQAGNIWTVSIPIDKVRDIAKMDELIYLESKKVGLKNKQE